MGVAACGFLFSACSEDIDEANLYTFTGQTVQDFLSADENLSEFKAIIEKSGINTLLDSYGTYTCFAPTNDAVNDYIDSLYNDASAIVEHNGLTANSLDGLLNSDKADSLCQDIAMFHVAGNEVMSIDMGGDKTIRTVLGRNVTTRLDSVSSAVVVNSYSHITSPDNEVENGVVHVIDCVLRRSDNLVAGEMEKLGDFRIWVAAMQLTGLNELLDSTARTTGIEWFEGTSPEAAYPYAEYPTECKKGFSVFAETDEVLSKNGINSVEDLAKYAREQYANVTEWYDYMVDKGYEVSLGTDYENQWNALNMFLRYHIITYAVPASKLVYSHNESNDFLYEYYRTMLPYTLFKVTKRKSLGDILWLNRFEENASLCETAGDIIYEEAFHRSTDPDASGIRINKENSNQAANGYIHPINGMLVYSSKVPNKVLKERLRFDFMSMLDEMMTNDYRGASGEEVKSFFNRTSNVYAVRFPVGYFENMKIYAGDVTRAYYLTKDECKLTGSSYVSWNNYQGDELYCKGAYDFAIKLPSVPRNGTYELRFGYVNNGQRTIVQFYLGRTSEKSSMIACDIPLNQNLSFSDPSIGWETAYGKSDNGASGDKTLRNHGYMRGPYYFSNWASPTEQQFARNRSGSGQDHIRRIITRQYFEMGDYWLRFKTALPENTEAEFQLDYVELVPVDVYNNATYSEDVF